MNQLGGAMALAILSVALPVGWFWLKGTGFKAGQAINEQWLGSAARFFYFVGLPYLAMIAGILPPRLLGLKGLENFVSINELQKALTLLLLEVLVDGSVVIGVGLIALLLLAGIRLGLAQVGLGFGYYPSALDTVYDCLHWAFYRAIFWLMSGALYLGLVWGIAWVLLEWVLLAWVQKNWPAQQQQFLTKTIILILTATIFFYSPNLWLLWPIHLAMVIIIRSSSTSKPEPDPDLFLAK
jgi:hypothetical protein